MVTFLPLEVNLIGLSPSHTLGDPYFDITGFVVSQ